jgi:hypothetical protein
MRTTIRVETTVTLTDNTIFGGLNIFLCLFYLVTEMMSFDASVINYMHNTFPLGCSVNQ